jgi:hypothetical protein
MKKLLNSLFAPMSKSEIEKLTREVKETIDFGYTQIKSRVFTPADLWNIQRNGKSRPQRRFL